MCLKKQVPVPADTFGTPAGHVNNMQSTNASSVECNSQCARVYASSMHRW